MTPLLSAAERHRQYRERRNAAPERRRGRNGGTIKRQGRRKSNQIKCIYKALRTSADISKCCTETLSLKPPNSKQCRCRSTVARKNSLERPNPRKNLREEPGYEGWPVLFWLCRVEIITEHFQDDQMFINY